MPRKIAFKLCPFCGTQIIGRKRADRNAYHYAPRCPDCTRKALTYSAKTARRAVLKKIRVCVPIGTKRLHKAGSGLVYVRIKIAEPNKWEYEHRVVAEAPRGFHVHHKNGNTLDNRTENLVVVSAAEHRIEHALTQWAKKYTFCKACGTTDKRHVSHGLCTTCYQRQYLPKK